jgi:3'(2'), 5'-bisphosphate nucleotidase
MIESLTEVVIAAGAAIMRVYDSGFDVNIKVDNSPVTAADAAAEAIILDGLARIASEIPAVAEEQAASGQIFGTDGSFFLVDPLDGTKEFIQRQGDFTVNVALIEDYTPVFGIVYSPATRVLFVGDLEAGEAWSATVDDFRAIRKRRSIHVRALPSAGISAVTSKSHNTPETEAYLKQFNVAECKSIGSSLKICMVAAGKADIYPRLAPTCEWDIAAGDAVLRAAGGKLHGPDGAPMRYGKPKFLNTGFVAAGDLSPPPIAPFLTE